VADFRLDFSTPAETAPASEPTSSTQPFDLSAIDLDLGETPIATPSTPWQEVTTKIALAQAYSEMGDVAGARELLNEALTEGDAEQQAQARALLDKVGAGVSS
jgi:pilus assembly protein FimV